MKKIIELQLLERLNTQIGELRDEAASRPVDERSGYYAALEDVLSLMSEHLTLDELHPYECWRCSGKMTDKDCAEAREMDNQENMITNN